MCLQIERWEDCGNPTSVQSILWGRRNRRKLLELFFAQSVALAAYAGIFFDARGYRAQGVGVVAAAANLDRCRRLQYARMRGDGTRLANAP